MRDVWWEGDYLLHGGEGGREGGKGWQEKEIRWGYALTECFFMVHADTTFCKKFLSSWPASAAQKFFCSFVKCFSYTAA